MKLPLRCACGSVQGEVDLERAWTRVSCYCRDCQAFARFLGRPGLMDAAGGSDITAMAPDAVRFTAGLEHLACMSLGPNGLLRWYAHCCRTPLANLTRNPKFFYCGLATACLEDTPPGTLQARLGARGAIAVQAASATAPVRGSRLRMLGAIVRIAAPVLGARLSRRRAGAPFFDAQGQPLRAPDVISRQQRAALQSPPG